MIGSKKRWIRAGVLAWMGTAFLWVLSPVIHRALNYCPVRPTGVNEAEAVPAFARKLKENCSACHTAFPKLNAFGRQYKKNGYVRERGESKGAIVVKAVDESKPGMWLEKPFPWGAIAKSRPLDTTNTGAGTKFMPLHELELFIAGGNVANKFSYFTEIEMESENQELEDSAGEEVDGTSPFYPKLAELVLGYHYNKYLNIYGGHRAFFMMDPYQTITSMGAQTANARMMPMLGQTSGQALGSEAQTLSLYGEVGKEDVGLVYYSIGMQTDASDPEGRGPRDVLGRLAFEMPQYGVMVGAFGMTGRQSGPGAAGVRPMYNILRGGFDFLVEYEDAFLQGAVTWFKDKTLEEGPMALATNRASYI